MRYFTCVDILEIKSLLIHRHCLPLDHDGLLHTILQGSNWIKMTAYWHKGINDGQEGVISTF